jgi:hypothetical protein
MTAGTKRTAAQLDEPSSIERKKIRPDGQLISNLLADIEGEFQRRKDEKESSFTKWEKEGR